MRRNVVYVRPSPRAGIFVWTWVVLFYLGVILPLMLVWLFMKYTMIGLVWVATQICVFLAARKANTITVEKPGRHRERPHPLERVILGKELAEGLRGEDPPRT